MGTSDKPNESNKPLIDRRNFINRAGKLAATGAVASALSTANTDAAAQEFSPRGHAGNLDQEFRRETFEVRIARAQADYSVGVGAPLGHHVNNGDDDRYPNKIGTDTRALPHDARGEVLPAAWKALAQAIRTRKVADFEKVPLGGSRKLTNPVGPFGINLTGLAAGQLVIAPAPALASAERAAEAVENYWAALLRDVPFHEYRNDTRNELILAAVRELQSLSGYTGPRTATGEVTPELLFRGTARYYDAWKPLGRRVRHVVPPGVTVGPYISQFALRDIPFGNHSISARGIFPLAGSSNEFLTTYAEWLSTRNGVATTRKNTFDPVARYLYNGRDLAQYAQGGTPVEWAAFRLLSTAKSNDPLVVGGLGAPSTPTNPYLKLTKQASGTGTWSSSQVASLLPQALIRALRADYFGKWYVHRTLRPESYGGLLHQVLANGVDYPLHDDVLVSEAVDRTFQKNGTFLSPQAFPQGAPNHPSYPGGSASQAAALGTILKAFYDEDFVIPDPVQPDPSDPTRLIPYVGAPLTVGGEINKLVANIAVGRQWSSVHWRSDNAVGLVEAEGYVIALLQDEVKTFPEDFEGFRFHRYDGSEVWIRP
jgi:hypothetical protein